MKVFDKINQQAAGWIKGMMRYLHTDDADKAMHALRAGLQALRDRLSVDEAAQLGAQLPLLIRGMCFEGWTPAGKPLRIRHRDEFLALVGEKYGRADLGAGEILAAMFHVIEDHVSAGEITDVILSLPHEIVTALAPHERDG